MGGSKVTKVKKKERNKTTQSKDKRMTNFSIIMIIMAQVTIYPVILAPHGLTTYAISPSELFTIQCAGNGKKSEKMSEVKNFAIDTINMIDAIRNEDKNIFAYYSPFLFS